MEKLSDILHYEKEIYSHYMFPTKLRFWLSRFKHEPARMIWRWQRISRKADFYHKKVGWINQLLYLYYVRKRNILGEKYGLEISTEDIGPGLLVYHYNNVINGKIGKNFHVHGNNCVGNGGPQNHQTPVIGDNVMLGVGAKVIGGVTIADNIKIAAGAVVVSSFLEPGITIGGVPARRIK